MVSAYALAAASSCSLASRRRSDTVRYESGAPKRQDRLHLLKSVGLSLVLDPQITQISQIHFLLRSALKIRRSYSQRCQAEVQEQANLHFVAFR